MLITNRPKELQLNNELNIVRSRRHQDEPSKDHDNGQRAGL